MAALRERPSLASDIDPEQQRMAQLRADACERMGNVNERLRACNRIAIESTEVGAGTLAELAVQEEQINRIQRLRRQVDGNLVQAKHHISATGSWLYSLFATAPKAPAPLLPAGSTRPRVPSPPPTQQQQQQQQQQQNSPGTARRAGKASTVLGSRFDEMEDQYQAGMEDLAANVRLMHKLAAKIGEELDKSNEQLAQLDTDLDRTGHELRKQHGRVNNLLHS